MSEAAHLVYREIPVISMSNSKALTSLSVSSQRAVMAESPLANVLQSLMRQSSRRFPLFHMQPTPSLSIPGTQLLGAGTLHAKPFSTSFSKK